MGAVNQEEYIIVLVVDTEPQSGVAADGSVRYGYCDDTPECPGCAQYGCDSWHVHCLICDGATDGYCIMCECERSAERAYAEAQRGTSRS